jgi:ABC-type nitrate/sulfonate/bicarbonate transport system substrate-binding protein
MRQLCLRLTFVICALAALPLAAVPAAAAEAVFHAGTPAGRAFAFLPLRIGVYEGLFAKNGLDIKVTDFGGGAKLQQAMVAGGIDLAVSAGTDMAFIAKGAPEKAVATAGYGTSLGIVVPYDSSAKTPSGLKGKNIGVTTAGSFTEWLLKGFMRQQGWGPRDVKIVYVGNITNEIALLTANRIGGVVAPDALGYQLALSKHGRLLLPRFDIASHFLGQALYASERIINDHPDVVRHFVKSWFETIEWMHTHKKETVEVTQSFQHFATAVVSKEYDQDMKLFTTNGKFDPAALKSLGQTFIQMKLLKHVPDMPKLYTQAFLPKN